mmetsp:Transcript_41350/g.54362  ORF Transcript_41350/g.54362 Transcript_41350/m.54362 type:complete len:91 (+) Transcript_41350:709-981(+)
MDLEAKQRRGIQKGFSRKGIHRKHVTGKTKDFLKNCSSNKKGEEERQFRSVILISFSNIPPCSCFLIVLVYMMNASLEVLGYRNITKVNQ